MFHYHAFDLLIAADRPIDHLTPAQDGTADTLIRAGDLERLRSEHAPEGTPRAFVSTAEGAYMYWAGVGSVLVHDGREIVTDFAGDAPNSLTSLALTGPPIGVLLQQRGNLVLHASAVVMDGAAVAFMGQKGLGKSTTASALSNAGHPLLTDDILSIDAGSAPYRVASGIKVVKLWPSAARALDHDVEEGDGEASDKLVKVVDGYVGEPVFLSAVFVLDAGTPGVVRESGKDAFLEVLRNNYAGRFIGSDGTPPSVFTQCAELVRTVPVFRLRRQPGLEALPEIVDVIQRTVHSVAA